jgi:hypothetical protein
MLILLTKKSYYAVFITILSTISILSQSYFLLSIQTQKQNKFEI